MAKKSEKALSKILSVGFKGMLFEIFNENVFVRQRLPLHDVFDFGCDRDGDFSCTLYVGIPAISTEFHQESRYPNRIISKALSSNVFKVKPHKWYRSKDGMAQVAEEIWSDFERAEPWYKRWTSLEQLADFERKSLAILAPETYGHWNCYFSMAKIYALMGDFVRADEALRPLEGLVSEIRKSPKENKLDSDYIESWIRKARDYLERKSQRS